MFENWMIPTSGDNVVISKIVNVARPFVINSGKPIIILSVESCPLFMYCNVMMTQLV